MRNSQQRPMAQGAACASACTRGGSARLDAQRGRRNCQKLQLENSRLRRLVTDLLLEKIKLEEVAHSQGFHRVKGGDGLSR